MDAYIYTSSQLSHALPHPTPPHLLVSVDLPSRRTSCIFVKSN